MLPLLSLLTLTATTMFVQEDENRALIKHASDSQVRKVSTHGVPATIGSLAAFKRPADLPDDLKSEHWNKRRVKPLETTVWVLECTVEEVAQSRDGDYRLVIKDSKGSKTVVEVPDPEECRRSPFVKQIQGARKAVADRLKPTKVVKKMEVKAHIEGLGFFGPIRKTSKNVPGNGARLMPALRIQFK